MHTVGRRDEFASGDDQGGEQEADTESSGNGPADPGSAQPGGSQDHDTPASTELVDGVFQVAVWH